jgi:hypothetical protein
MSFKRDCNSSTGVEHNSSFLVHPQFNASTFEMFYFNEFKSLLEPSKHRQYCEMHKTEELTIMVNRMNKIKQDKLALERHASEINAIYGEMVPIKECVDKMKEFGIVYKHEVDRVAEYLGKTKIGGRWKVYKDRMNVFDYRLFNMAK